VTEKVGLAATLSSTYNAPYELARQLASIDHVSDGRAAWNVVTTFSNSAAKDSGGDQVAYNFSKEKHLDHATRYDRAREFVTLLKLTPYGRTFFLRHVSDTPFSIHL
jgi:N-acetyl-S-(2-succino)cysteine monooxygenase